MVTGQQLFSLAMAAVTQEKLTALRAEVVQLKADQDKLREAVKGLENSEAGLHAALDGFRVTAGERTQKVEELVALVPTTEEFLHHLKLIDAKLPLRVEVTESGAEVAS